MAKNKTRLVVPASSDETTEKRLARAIHQPVVRNASVASGFASRSFTDQQPAITDSVQVLRDVCAEVRDGDLKTPTDILTAQALTLDAMFTEMARRCAENLGQYPQAAESYMRMAMKAQAQSRTTIEALAKLVRPNEQIVKHVYVDNRGGQAVFAESVSQGGTNGNALGQSHGPDTLGAPLLGEDPAGHGVPMPCDAREEEMPHSRRCEPWRAEG